MILRSAFTKSEFQLATQLLAARVATMLGRKMEEADWDFVYCNAKKIPNTDWSNLNIDINHNGLGVEHKMLRVTTSSKSLLNECGTTKMHPSGTRSIRIPAEKDATLAAREILTQYSELITAREKNVKEKSGLNFVDMRIGWLLWKDSLDEFLYFEEEMKKPNVMDYHAQWHSNPAKGARKASRSLWIYETSTGRKKFSVTTDAGAKIQPYFDIPNPNDPNLYYFKVQGVVDHQGFVELWATQSTAKYIALLCNGLDKESLSKIILDSPLKVTRNKTDEFYSPQDFAIPVKITKAAYEKLKTNFENISDEFLLRQFALSFSSQSETLLNMV